MSLKAKILVEENDSIQKVLRKCVKVFLEDDTNPGQIGAALAAESMNVLLSFAPNPEIAYSVLFSALKDITDIYVEKLEEENSTKEDIASKQNAPSSNILQ